MQEQPPDWEQTVGRTGEPTQKVKGLKLPGNLEVDETLDVHEAKEAPVEE